MQLNYLSYLYNDALNTIHKEIQDPGQPGFNTPVMRRANVNGQWSVQALFHNFNKT